MHGPMNVKLKKRKKKDNDVDMSLNTKTLATRPHVYLLLCVITYANKGLRFGHV